MRCYGVQPSELAKLSIETKIGLLANMTAINARERLEFILDIGAAFSGKSSREYLMALIDQAYSSWNQHRSADKEMVLLPASCSD